MSGSTEDSPTPPSGGVHDARTLAGAPSTSRDDETTDGAPRRTDDGVHDDGTLIRYFGDYELRGILGRGGMGVVYRARQLSLNRVVALKMIRAEGLAAQADLRRFQNEAEAVAQLDHPHIVPILEVGRRGDQRYFTMKLIDGPSLDRTLDVFLDDPKAAARLVATVARAVHHAHQRGILHRDLKPSNILLDERREPYVTDFGLAKRVEGGSELTHTGAILGTPAYMAPEQASGRHGSVTVGTDVYGLGAVFYAVLTGSAPFGGTDVLETLSRVLDRPPEPPSRLNPRVPRDLETICLKCLEKDANRRYATAQALAEDLERYQSGEPIAARPVSPIERAAMWVSRRPGTAALVFLVMMTALAGFAGILWQWQEAVAARRDASRLATGLAFDRGLGLCEQGKLADGLLWMARALGVAQADDPLQRPLRANLTAWARKQPVLTSVSSPQPEGVRNLRLSLDGTRVLKAEGENVRVYGALDDKPLGPPIQSARPHLSQFRPDGKSVLIVGGQAGGTEEEGRSAAGAAAVVKSEPKDQLRKDHERAKTARLWDPETGQPLSPPLVASSPSLECAFSPDGAVLATANYSFSILNALAGNLCSIHLWNLAEGHHIDPVLRGVPLPGPIRFSPDGSRIAVVDDSSATLRLFDVKTAKALGKPAGNRGASSRPQPIRALAFRPDGTALLSGGEDQTISVRNPATGEPIGAPWPQGMVPLQIAFRPDGRTVLVVGDDGTARAWDFESRTPLGPPMRHPSPVVDIAFGPDGRSVVTLTSDAVRVWMPAAGQALAPAIPPPPARTNGYWVSPNGRRAVVLGVDDSLQIWDLVAGSPVGPPLEHEGYTHSATFSPDGTRVVVSGLRVKGETDGDGGVKFVSKKTYPCRGAEHRLWDAEIGQAIGPPLPCDDPATKHVIKGSGSTEPSSPVSRLQLPSWCKFSPDGRTIALVSCEGGDKGLFDILFGKVVFLDVATQQPHLGLSKIPKEFLSPELAFSPDSKLLAMVLPNSRTPGPVESFELRVWETATGRQVGPPLRRPDAQAVPHFRDGRNLVFRPDGRVLAVGFVVIPTSPGARKTSGGTASQFWGVMTIFWDVASGREVSSPLLNHDQVTFFPDGRTVLARDAREAVIWDLEAGKQVGPPYFLQRTESAQYMFVAGRKSSQFFRHPTSAVALSPDGSLVLTGCSDGYARLWDASTGKPVTGPMAQQGPVVAVAFSPDGRTVLTGGEDRTARLWDTATGRPLGPPFPHAARVDQVGFGSGGRFVWTVDEAGSVRAWSAPDPIPGAPERVSAWLATIAGARLDGDGVVTPLDPKTWADQFQALNRMGGPPVSPRDHGPPPTNAH
jgi:WD40 repeat protein/predicted Ser/Thr protein kinase